MRPINYLLPTPVSVRVLTRLCVVSALLSLGVATLGLYAARTNVSSAARERLQLSRGLGAEFAKLSETLRPTPYGREADGSVLSARFNVAPTLALTPKKILGGSPQVWATAGAALVGSLVQASQGRSADSFVTVGPEVFAARTEPFRGSRADAVAALTKIDAEFLARLQRSAGLRTLRLAGAGAGAEGEASLQLVPSGTALLWSSPRLTSSFYEQLSLCLASLSACLICIATFYGGKVTARYAANEAAARQLAGHDVLSGLQNRRSFTFALDAEIARAVRNSGALALLYIDLDGFKKINDYFGHEAGDKLIVGAGQRIAAALRGGDRVARFGGDEFAVMLTDVHHAIDAEIVCKRLLAAVEEPFELGGREAFVGMSIGVAFYPRDAVNRDELMRLADLALYRAKNGGRGRFAFFETRMGDELRLRRSMEKELKLAIERDELAIAYQPVFAADGETIVGAEALTRWPHPLRGVIQPDQFIGLAEDRGLIGSLSEWVLRRTCLDANHWPGLKVAVNVSPIQFGSRDFVAMVARVLSETGRDPNLLELELTESVVIENADGAEQSMIELRAMGVSLALDDYGTGCSSLIYLRRFLFDKIKINRSFLASMEPTGQSAVLIASIVNLGRSLGLTMTADGVETEEQRRILQASRCHQMQGLALSGPLDAQAFQRFFTERAQSQSARAKPLKQSLRGAA